MKRIAGQLVIYSIYIEFISKLLLPVPAVFLVNTDGIIQFQYVNPNYTVRLKKEVILAAAKAFLQLAFSQTEILVNYLRDFDLKGKEEK